MALDAWSAAAWSIPLATSTKVVEDIPIIAASYSAAVKNDTARGSITVMSNWDRLTDVIDPDNDAATVIHLYQNKAYVGSFFAKRASEAVEDAGGTTTITGPGLSDMAAWAPVLFYDWPTNPSVDKDFVWGAERTAGSFTNGGLEDDPDSLGGNGGFENAEITPWQPAPDDTYFTAPIVATTSTTTVRTGTYSMLVDINGGAKAGAVATFPCLDGERYQVQAYLREPDATGDDYWFGIGPVTDAAQVHTVGAFIENGYAWVSKTGADSWKVYDVDVTLDAGATTANLATVHDGSADREWYVDDVTLTGPGIGVAPWEPSTAWDPGDTPPTMDTFVVNTTDQRTGTYCLEFQGDIYAGSTGAKLGAKQSVSGLTPGATYRFTAWVDHDNTGVDETFVIFAKRPGGEWFDSTQYQVNGGTWKELTVEFTPTTADAEMHVRWSETGPSTSPTCYIDDAVLSVGLAAASPGEILRVLHEDISVDHISETSPYDIDILGFLNLSFSDTLDSNSDAWSPATLEYRARRGRSWASILRDFAKQGIEWRWRHEPATNDYYLDLFNPYDPSTFTGGRGDDLRTTGAATGTSHLIVDGDGVTGGAVVKSSLGSNVAIAEGKDGAFSVSQDATAQTSYDARAVYSGNVDFVASKTAENAADQLLLDTVTYKDALKVMVENPETNRLPWTDYQPGDRITTMINGAATDRRVVKIATRWDGTHARHTIDLDAETYGAAPVLYRHHRRARPEERWPNPPPSPGEPTPPPPTPPGDEWPRGDVESVAAAVQRISDELAATSNTYLDDTAATTTTTTSTTTIVESDDKVWPLTVMGA